jgi:hypothetical protein
LDVGDGHKIYWEARGNRDGKPAGRSAWWPRVGHFIDDDALARDAAHLSGIPGILIRGAHDFAPPLDLFWRFARDWPESEFVLIDEEGHRGRPGDGRGSCASDRRVREQRLKRRALVVQPFSASS